MTTKREIPNANHIINEYLSGSPIGKLLKENGISDCLFYRLLRDAGVNRRSKQDSYILRRGISKPDIQWKPESPDLVLEKYAAGFSVNQISKDFGASRQAVNRFLRRNGIEPRSQSEAEALKWSKMKGDRAAVERQCSAAWSVSRAIDDALEASVVSLYRRTDVGIGLIAEATGTTRTNAKRIIRKNGGAFNKENRRATGMYALRDKSPIVSKYEMPLARTMRDAGLVAYHQYPIGPCNVDFAFPELRVAVEVERISMCASKSLSRERVEYLFNLGWRILIIYDVKKRGIDYASVTQQIISALNILGGNPSISGKYGVISRDGKISTRTGNNLHGWPRIEGL